MLSWAKDAATPTGLESVRDQPSRIPADQKDHPTKSKVASHNEEGSIWHLG